jgi:hypothetical protein
MEDIMATGPGKYDDIATMAMNITQAEGVIVIVLNGNKGYGFSAQFDDPVLMRNVPGMLRSIADQIDADSKALGARP